MNPNIAAEAILRDSTAAPPSSPVTSRSWRLVDQNGTSVSIDPSAPRERRSARPMTAAIRTANPLEFQAVAAVSLDDLDLAQPRSESARLEPHSMRADAEVERASEPTRREDATPKSELPTETRRELIEVIQSWMGLSNDLRAAILAIVRSNG